MTKEAFGLAVDTPHDTCVNTCRQATHEGVPCYSLPGCPAATAHTLCRQHLAAAKQGKNHKGCRTFTFNFMTLGVDDTFSHRHTP